jgi:uncharacterized protein YciW
MQTLRPVDPSTLSGEASALFAAFQQRLNRIPNMIRLMANSPAILDAYLRFNEAFAIGRQEGLSDDELTAAQFGRAAEPRTEAALRFATEVVRDRGHAPSSEVERLREAGFDDQEIVEIIALIALNIFRNYFNLVAGTEVDFPLVTANSKAREAAFPSHVS